MTVKQRFNRVCRWTVLSASFLLAACSTTGRSFNSMALSNFVPGQTTYAQAVEMLGSEPENTYSQLNGTMIARWAHKNSVLTDAIYFRQELMLRFSPDGRFERVVDSVNVLGQPGGQKMPAHGQVYDDPTMSATIAPTPVKVTTPMPPPPSPVRQPNPELEQPLHSQSVTYPVRGTY